MTPLRAYQYYTQRQLEALGVWPFGSKASRCRAVKKGVFPPPVFLPGMKECRWRGADLIKYWRAVEVANVVTAA